MAKTLDSCDRCFGTAKMEKQLLVAMGTAVYLALPWYEGLLPGHCQIVPVQHVTCATELDEDVWTEVVVSVIHSISHSQSYCIPGFDQVNLDDMLGIIEDIFVRQWSVKSQDII